MATARRGRRARRIAIPSKTRSTSHPALSGLGIGGRLLDALLSECAGAGVRQVIAVIVDSDGAASLALHRNRRFIDAGRLTAVGFKHGQWLDTLLLQRSLAEVTD